MSFGFVPILNSCCPDKLVLHSRR